MANNNIKIGDKVMYHGEVHEVKGFRTLAVRYVDIGVGYDVDPDFVDKVSDDTYHSNVVSLNEKEIKENG